MPAKSIRDRAPRQIARGTVGRDRRPASIGIYFHGTCCGLSRLHSRSDAELAITTKRAALPRQKRLRSLPDFRSGFVDGIPRRRNTL